MIKLLGKFAVLTLCLSLALGGSIEIYAGVLDNILDENGEISEENNSQDTQNQETEGQQNVTTPEPQDTPAPGNGSDSEPVPTGNEDTNTPVPNENDENKNPEDQTEKSKETFSDIGEHWARSRILEAVRDGYVSGYKDGTFQPDRTITRAEFATMMNKALKNTKYIETKFKDVGKNEWYYEQISMAVAAGLFSGGTDGTFKPDNAITRQEAAKVISCAMTSATIDGDGATLMADYDAISDWAKESVNAAANKGYINGYPEGLYKPTKALTRAEAVKIIGDILDNENIEYGFNITEYDELYRDTVVVGDVKILDSVGAGNITLTNVTVLGDLVISAGSIKTITLSDVRVKNLRVENSQCAVEIICNDNVYVDTLSLAGSSFVTQQGTNIVINNN